MTVIDKDGDAFNVRGDWEVPSVDCSSASDGAMYIQVGPAAMHRGNQGEHNLLLGDTPDVRARTVRKQSYQVCP